MKKIKYLRLFAVLVLLFVLRDNLRGDEQKPAQPLNYKEKQSIQFTPAKTKVKQAKQKQTAEEKAKKEEQKRVEAEAGLKEKQQEFALKETQLKAHQEELAREREERLKQEAKLQAKREQDRKTQEARLKARREKETEEKMFKLGEERKAREEEFARQREEANAKINEFKKASAQEKIFTGVMLKKQQEDRAKIEKIEKLWKRARKLYNQENYEEAIHDFQKIIDLEGNPRIKYTPYAREYIDRAKTNILQKKGAVLSNEIELSEKEMVNEVLKQQVPPYIEPPKRNEQREPAPLIEPPAIRKELKAAKITIDFDKVALKSVISFFSQESGINFIASQKVLDLALVVSARFKETSLDEAIKYITKSLGLVYRVDKEIVWVAHPEEIANELMETKLYYQFLP